MLELKKDPHELIAGSTRAIEGPTSAIEISSSSVAGVGGASSNLANTVKSKS